MTVNNFGETTSGNADPNDGTGQIRVPAGFQFGSVAGGIKPSGKPDVSLIVGNKALTAAGVYTTNQVVAAPVTWCQSRTPSNCIRAVATVSGNANACTGQQGEADNAQIAELTAKQLGCQADEVLVMSTGIIGRFLPMEKIEAAFPKVAAALQTSPESLKRVAEAIRTTDNDRKIASEIVELSSGPVTITAICKGAGMIAPNMATLLAVAMTDASLTPAQAQTVLTSVAEKSLNRITVDGHASTNDTFLLLASGAARSGTATSDEQPADIDNAANSLNAKDLIAFEDSLTRLAINLGKQIVADGEGATHYMALTVRGAADDAAAEKIARHTAQSLLVKTAVTGNDPNWGRIVSAAGAAGVPIDVARTSLEICGVAIYDQGTPLDFDQAAVSSAMASAIEVPVQLTVGEGHGTATLWASDLTKAYVAFNSEYTT